MHVDGIVRIVGRGETFFFHSNISMMSIVDPDMLRRFAKNGCVTHFDALRATRASSFYISEDSSFFLLSSILPTSHLAA